MSNWRHDCLTPIHYRSGLNAISIVTIHPWPWCSQEELNTSYAISLLGFLITLSWDDKRRPRRDSNPGPSKNNQRALALTIWLLVYWKHFFKGIFMFNYVFTQTKVELLFCTYVKEHCMKENLLDWKASKLKSCKKRWENKSLYDA